MSKRMIFLFLLFLFVGFETAFCGEVKKTMEFSLDDLLFSKSGEFDMVYLSGCNITDKIGAPQLPVKSISFSIPANSRAVRVEVNSYEKVEIRGVYSIYPHQPPQILSLNRDEKDEIPFTSPDPKVYSSSQAYPGKIAELVGSGYMGVFQIVDVLVYPLEYAPQQEKLFLYKKIDLTLHYVVEESRAIPHKRKSQMTQKVFDKILGKKLLNSKGEVLESTQKGTSLLPPGDYEYVIMTKNVFASYFQPLADWKTKKGVPATVVTTEWVTSNYSGIDYQERFRNFIKDAYQNWGTTWVLLGADTFVIPARLAYAMASYAGMHSYEDSIACDLYYADLDGNWNFDGDGIFGEVEDSVDMYPEVFVGRAPVSSTTKATTFVNKVITYEKNPPLDYQLKMLFAAEILWSNPYTDQGINKDFIDQEYVPPRFDPITKLYQSWGNESSVTVITAINEGQSIINHDGHCWINTMGVGDGSLGLADMDTLINAPRYSILYSIGCWPAAFDYDCMAEHFVNNPNGGGVAFIGNSRYGWGSPGNPVYGYSNLYDQKFFETLFIDDIHNLGAALANSKAYYVSRSRQENVYRIHQYEVNLIGDPELPVWTDTPQILIVDHPSTLPLETQALTVTVTYNSLPVEEALVCVMKGSEVYQRGLTDFTGQVSFDISPATEGELDITVTAHNFLPYEGTALVTAGGPFLSCISNVIDDSQGNSDGLVNPDETINFSPCLKNLGPQTAYNVSAYLRTDDGMVTLIDSFGVFGDIASGDSATGDAEYSFSVSSGCVNGEVIYFTLFIEDEDDNSWSNSISVPVATPVLAFSKYQVIDNPGNKNGIPEPGETFDLNVILKNTGLGYANGVTAEISTEDSYISIEDSTEDFGQILPEQSQRGTFILEISSECPSKHFPILTLDLATSDSYEFEENFILNIGSAYFVDDMESGASGWTHSGTKDDWGLSSYRSHSGDSSWYCGSIYHFYDNGMNCYLTSPHFVLAPNSYLSFWRWFDVAIYGTDGLYVEVDAGSGWDTLDFIGSGGALDSLLMGDDWHKETYDLSSYPLGSMAQVRFRFVSNEDWIEEGFYIDDVKVGPLYISGDTDGDEYVNVTDVVFLINYLFKSGMTPAPLLAGDVNCNFEVDVTDVVYLINYLFKNGPPPSVC
jgi:hypothetical protein